MAKLFFFLIQNILNRTDQRLIINFSLVRSVILLIAEGNYLIKLLPQKSDIFTLVSFFMKGCVCSNFLISVVVRADFYFWNLRHFSLKEIKKNKELLLFVFLVSLICFVYVINCDDNINNLFFWVRCCLYAFIDIRQ